MTLKSDHTEEVFEGEGIKEVEVGSKSDTRREGLRETLEAFFDSVESQCHVGGMTVGFLVESLQEHLHLSEEDAEHIVVLLGDDISAHIKKEVFVDCALSWWEIKGNAEDQVIEGQVEVEVVGKVRIQNQLDGSSFQRSSLEDLEDLHFLEEQKVELEEKLKLSGKSVEKWRRQYFAKAAQCELEEARFLIKFSVLKL